MGVTNDKWTNFKEKLPETDQFFMAQRSDPVLDSIPTSLKSSGLGSTTLYAFFRSISGSYDSHDRSCEIEKKIRPGIVITIMWYFAVCFLFLFVSSVGSAKNTFIARAVEIFLSGGLIATCAGILKQSMGARNRV
jgi:hypothetical protein